MNVAYHHFSVIAPKYNTLRTTDSLPVSFVARSLPPGRTVRAADVGCGAGRYDVALLRLMGPRLRLLCIDENTPMLRALANTLSRRGLAAEGIVRARASALPARGGTLDAVLTFNAIHHFHVGGFLAEAARTLRRGGRLFIYTRFRSQNRSNIWGRFFPGFHEKETRLFELAELRGHLARADGLRLERVERFRFRRVAPLERLLQQARHHHYSTFALYDPGEFEEALARFEEKLRREFPDSGRITWHDENVMLVAARDAA